MKNKELPLIGSAIHFGRDPLSFFDDLKNRCGDIVPYSMLGVPFLAVTDPELIEHVLTKNYGNYSKSVYIKKKWAAFLGEGLISADGPVWKQSRRLLQPFMGRDKFGRYFETVMSESASAVSKIEDGSVIDMQKFTMRTMLFSLVKMLFHSEMSHQQIERIGILFAECISYFNYTLTPAGMLLESFPTPQKQSYFRAIKELDEFIYGLIRQPESKGLGQVLVAMKMATDENNSPLPEKLIRDQILTLFLAGHETSALTINYVLFLLAKHPAELQKVQAELDNILGDRDPKFEDLEQLHHLKNVINEAFRLYPPVSVIGRESIGDDQYRDFSIRKGVNISIPVHVVHRDPRWYYQPEQFLPERWNDVGLTSKKGIFLPFGSGPRLCIGAGLSMVKMSTLLAVILKKFDISLKSSPELEFVVSLTTRPKENIQIQFRKRVAQVQKKSA